MNRIPIWALAALCSTFATTARAEFIVRFREQGANVVAIGNGSINVKALSDIGGINEEPGVHGDLGYAWLGVWPGSLQPFYTGISGPGAFGPSDDVFVPASTASGNLIGRYGANGALVVPSGYVSGTTLSNTTTWDNRTIAGLGLTPGTYTWTWGSGLNADSFVVDIAATPVPESSSFIAFGIGCASLLLAYGRRWSRRSGRCGG